MKSGEGQSSKGVFCWRGGAGEGTFIELNVSISARNRVDQTEVKAVHACDPTLGGCLILLAIGVGSTDLHRPRGPSAG